MKVLLRKLDPIIRRMKRIIGFVNRISVYSAPFVFCTAAIVHGVLYINEYNGEFMYQLGEMTGHSIYCIYFILIFTQKMCKWYKASCWTLILHHVFNMICYKIIFLYGNSFITPIRQIYSMIIFSTISLLLWFISDSCKRAIKLISQAYKHGQK